MKLNKKTIAAALALLSAIALAVSQFLADTTATPETVHDVVSGVEVPAADAGVTDAGK